MEPILAVEYFSFSNDLEGKTGVVTLAICSSEDEFSEKPLEERVERTFRVGYSLTSPGEKFNRGVSEKQAYEMLISSCIVMCNRPPSDEKSYICRVAWCSAGRNYPGVPNWAKELDLAMKAVLL